jgi:hypothetical protein
MACNQHRPRLGIWWLGMGAAVAMLASVAVPVSGSRKAQEEYAFQ